MPVFNSSRFNTTFHTGILWDNSTGAGYDPIIKQPIVWVVKVNTTQVDAYGNYQYLVSIPYTLSTYEGGNSLVSFYAELQ
ncbi:MAG: hypothetical protein NTV88_05055 [Candidatus Micrarchaeota archaeon]|nr:hypothetical protein [Candidatus Micrarchaeota archaeon]